jgi:hypothetical protein
VERKDRRRRREKRRRNVMEREVQGKGHLLTKNEE